MGRCPQSDEEPASQLTETETDRTGEMGRDERNFLWTSVAWRTEGV